MNYDVVVWSLRAQARDYLEGAGWRLERGGRTFTSPDREYRVQYVLMNDDEHRHRYVSLGLADSDFRPPIAD
jgi:hypothetical protein